MGMEREEIEDRASQADDALTAEILALREEIRDLELYWSTRSEK